MYLWEKYEEIPNFINIGPHLFIIKHCSDDINQTPDDRQIDFIPKTTFLNSGDLKTGKPSKTQHTSHHRTFCLLFTCDKVKF